MKRGNISNVIKLLILAAGIILACILVAIGFYIGRSGKSYVNNGSNQYAKMMSEYDDLDITLFDELEVPGKELIKFIEKFPADYISVRVYTTQHQLNAKSGTSDSKQLYKEYTAENHAIETDKLSDNYINPIATFTGKVYRNKNNVVNLVEFVQRQ